jgi:hypothetical protein
MDMQIKHDRPELFNGQIVIRSHRIDKLDPFYEMLSSTNPDKSHEIRIVNGWGDFIQSKDIPFAITLEEDKITKNQYIRFWVFGTEKKH